MIQLQQRDTSQLIKAHKPIDKVEQKPIDYPSTRKTYSA
jgi:hypothetical protein